MRLRVAAMGLWVLIVFLGIGTIGQTAGAASITLVPQSPTSAAIGDIVDFYIFLDAPEGLGSFRVGVLFDPTVARYEPSESRSEVYLLYGGGKGATYLVTEANPWMAWPGDTPPGLDRVDIAFVSYFPEGTKVEARNTYVGKIAFSVIAAGLTDIELNFVDLPGTVFNVDGTDIKASVGVNSIATGWVPEPASGLLLGLGLVGLAAYRRRPTGHLSRESPAARKILTGLLVGTFWFVSASEGHAVSIILVPATPTTVAPGEIVDFDILLLDAPADIRAFDVAVVFRGDLLEYAPERSNAKSYILYTGGKGANYLVPSSSPWATWPGPLPAGLARVDIAYREFLAGGAAPRADGHVVLGNIAFEWIGSFGLTTVELNFIDFPGTHFVVDGVDIKDSVRVNGIDVVVVPEPATALLVGLGLGAVGVASRRRRNH